jgi:azurin
MIPLLSRIVAICALLWWCLPAHAQKKKSPDPQAGVGKGADQNRVTNQKDAKNQKTDKPEPSRDPSLAAYGIFEESAPNPAKTAPVATTLPLKLAPGTRIAFVGNTLLDRSQDYAWLESQLHLAHPDHQLVLRHFAWSADEVDLQPRPDNFATVKQHLTREKIDVIFAAFGYNESFAGPDAIDSFKARLTTWLIDTKTSAFNGKTGPQIVLVSPIANENIAGVPAADLNNERLAAYVAAMAEVAKKEQVGFANVFDATRAAMSPVDSDLTINGAHLTSDGYRAFADQLFRETFGESAPADRAELRATLVDQFRQYFRRYRPLNTFYYTGGRNKEYGYLDFLPAMRNFDLMTANREARAWDIAKGRSFVGKPVDDSNVPPLEAVSESRGANEWLKAADELKAFRVDPRFEVNLFAGEEQFPDIANPIQMRWDAKGRLWVSCSTTYPHIYPGQEPNDKIVILEDTDRDGKADKSTVWADDIHIPLSFELYRDGILVSEEPHFSWIRDTDRDGKADKRERMLTGFGCEDSHHALHDFVWTPDGELLFRESIFHNSQVETPYGPVRAKNSAWFQFRPATQRLITFGNYPNTNPWGVTFDDWGRHVASHPIYANAFHALNPPYPAQHPAAAGIPAYSGVAGHEFVDFPMWPEELRGGFVKVRYKPTNKVEFHQWIEKDDHFEEEFAFDIIFSENLSFIPVDTRFGPRGDLYVCDWYNPVKGHAQYSLRDPRRDRSSGRIWRIVPKGAALQNPPVIDGAPLTALLDNLKRPEYRYRYWTKRELRDRHMPADVAKALDTWVAKLDPKDARYRHHQMEALWVYRSIGQSRSALLTELLDCEIPHARAAATQQLRYAVDPVKAGLSDNGIALDQAAALLRNRAGDESGLVRLEAAVAASHLGTPAALEAMLAVLERPMSAHLKYAAQTALGSAPLERHWKGNTAFLAAHPKLDAFVKSWNQPKKPLKGLDMPPTPEQRAFDEQPGLKAVEITCVPERLLFDVTRIEVAAGQPVKLTLINPDATQHNLAIVQPGALEEIGMAGNEMAKDPGGFAKGFIPESPKILHHTKLLEPQSGEVLRFKAPEKPGVYPYLCTFPGHWIVMKGELMVK